MTFDEIVSRITTQIGEIIISKNEGSTPKSIEISADHVQDCFSFLYQDEQLYFDMLSCVTGLDNGVEAKTVEVIYNLYSIPFDHHLMVKVVLPRENPETPTVSGIWKTANWLERETYDMYGIHFTDHPDLRRILLPADWEGYPLLKDYTEQEVYRGIRVAYGEKEEPKDIPGSDGK